MLFDTLTQADAEGHCLRCPACLAAEEKKL
jgi:hypothetical protein